MIHSHIQVFYASQTGNAEWIAKHIHSECNNRGYSANINVMDFFSVNYTFCSLVFSPPLLPSLAFSSLLFSFLLFSSLVFSSLLFSPLHFTSLLFSCLLFSSLLSTSLHFPSLLFSSLHFTSLPFSSLSSFFVFVSIPFLFFFSFN
jgi:hypothetical protein